MTSIDQAIFHLKQAERWFDRYKRKGKTTTRRIILEYHITSTKFHLDKARKDIQIDFYPMM